MKTIIIFSLIAALFIVGCQFYDLETQPSDTLAVDNTGEQGVPASEGSVSGTNSGSETVSGTTTTSPVTTTKLPACTKNADCSGGKFCVNKECKTLNDVYTSVANCQKKCNYNSVAFTTSDGESYNLKRGEGSYSYAGALEWKVKPLPDYCQGQAPKVALLLLKKNAGKVLEETYLTLGVGETSSLITHPTIKRVQFTTKVTSIEEVCS